MITSKVDIPTNEPVIDINCRFDAAPERLWQMNTDPLHLNRWWGPRGSTNLGSEMDVRLGGIWRQCLRFPDGREFIVSNLYLKIAQPRCLAYRNIPNDYQPGVELAPARMLTTISFEPEGTGTRMTAHVVFSSTAERDKHVKWGFPDTVTSANARLADYLATITE